MMCILQVMWTRKKKSSTRHFSVHSSGQEVREEQRGPLWISVIDALKSKLSDRKQVGIKLQFKVQLTKQIRMLGCFKSHSPLWLPFLPTFSCSFSLNGQRNVSLMTSFMCASNPHEQHAANDNEPLSEKCTWKDCLLQWWQKISPLQL